MFRWLAIPYTTVDSSVPQHVQVAGNTIDIVESFTYLGSLIGRSGSCEAELVRRIAIARDCMTQLDRTSGAPVYPWPPTSPLLCICPACLFVRSRELDNNKGNVSEGRCLLPMVPVSHPPNPLQSARVQRRSQPSHRLSTSVRDHQFHTVRLFGHIARAVPGMHHCRHQQPSTGLEKTERTPGTHQLRPTWSHVTLASTLPGIEHKTEMHGTDLCRQLCPSLESDVDDELIHLRTNGVIRHRSADSFDGCFLVNQLLTLGLPSFTALVHNYRAVFTSRIAHGCNTIVQCMNSHN